MSWSFLENGVKGFFNHGVGEKTGTTGSCLLKILMLQHAIVQVIT